MIAEYISISLISEFETLFDLNTTYQLNWGITIIIINVAIINIKDNSKSALKNVELNLSLSFIAWNFDTKFFTLLAIPRSRS